MTGERLHERFLFVHLDGAFFLKWIFGEKGGLFWGQLFSLSVREDPLLSPFTSPGISK